MHFTQMVLNAMIVLIPTQYSKSVESKETQNRNWSAIWVYTRFRICVAYCLPNLGLIAYRAASLPYPSSAILPGCTAAGAESGKRRQRPKAAELFSNNTRKNNKSISGPISFWVSTLCLSNFM